MTDIKLFALDAGSVTEIPGNATLLEKSLQRLIETSVAQRVTHHFRFAA